MTFPKGVYSLSCIWREKDNILCACVSATITIEALVAYM